MRRGKRAIWLGLAALLIWLLPALAGAEVSSNLKRVEVKGKKSHRVEEVWFEDAEGNRCFAEDLGYASAHYKYNGKPRCTLEEYFDLDGNLCMISAGYAVVKQTWDNNGRLLTRSYYDTADNLILGPEGYATKRNVYDHTKQSKLVYYGVDGEYLRSESLCAVTKYSYDKLRQLVGIECLDADLQLMNNADGYATMVRTYKGNEMASEYFYDAEGNLAYHAGRGYAGFQRTYKPTTSMTLKMEYFGADGHLMMYKERYAIVNYEYTGGSNYASRVIYEDTEGNPAIQRGGYAATDYTYDGRGRATSMIFLDENLEKVITSAGYGEIRRLYTSGNKVWYESYHDLNGRLIVVESKGYAKVERKYSSTGNLKQENYYDETGLPIAVEEGYCALQCTWKNGLKRSESYLNENGKLTNTVYGYARVDYTYDEDGRNTVREYFDKDGRSVDSEHGYARCEMSYLSDQPTSYRYYHMDGEPGEGPEGVFETRMRYQEEGEIQETSCYDQDGNPALSDEGWFRRTYLFDENGRKYGVLYTDTGSQPVVTTHGYATMVSSFNEHGQVITTSYFGAEGTLIISDNGYASIAYEYDEDQQQIARTYLDPAGELILVKGAAGYRQTWADGKVATRTTFGLNGTPAPATDTYTTSVYGYDEEGRVSEIFYLDETGNPIASKKAVYGVRYVRDKNGKISQERYLTAEGEPMNCKDGYPVRALEYNDEGQLSRETYLDEKGKKNVAAANGSGGRSLIYREDGQMDTVTYLDLKGNPMELSRGYAVIRMIYDDENQLIARRYENLSGEVIREQKLTTAEEEPEA